MIDNQRMDTLKLFFRNPTGVIGLGLLLFYVFLAAAGPYLAPYNPLTIHLNHELLPPSSAHLMGTDDYGRDIWSRILYAIRLDMLIAFFSVSIAYSIGVPLGIFAGYMGKVTDSVIMRFMDILFALPSILFAIAISISLGPGFTTIIIAIVVVTIPLFSRIARSTVLSTKNDLYVTASVSQGGSRGHIMLHHILPSTISPTTVLYAINLGGAIVVAAALSFLGVGIPPPTPELGAMVSEGLQYTISGQWWLTIFPGIFIMFIVIAFNMLGDAIREVTDVTLRR